MRARSLCAATAAFAVVSCQPGGVVGAAAIEQQISKQEADWNKAYAQRDAPVISDMYADDAVIASAGLPLLRGKDAISKEIRSLSENRNVSLHFQRQRIKVAASGDLAYTGGEYTITMTDAGKSVSQIRRGNYINVWQKQADGTWKVIEDLNSPGPEIAGPTL